jgi:hypothetical protein
MRHIPVQSMQTSTKVGKRERGRREKIGREEGKGVGEGEGEGG